MTEEEVMSIESMHNLVKHGHLKFAGATGTKHVKAFFNMFRDKLQVTFKYGREFYRFDVVKATEDQQRYAEFHNMKK